jgi:tellurite methyltransferase
MSDFKDKFNNKYRNSLAVFGNEPLPLVKEAAKILKSGRVLDLGVGDGRNALYLLEQGFEVTGVDVSEVGLENLQKKARKYESRLKLIHEDVTKLTIDESFDLILGIGLLHFLALDDIKKVVTWTQKHTNKNGINIFIARMIQNPMGNLPYVFEEGVMKTFYNQDGWEVLRYHEDGKRVSIMARKNI